MRASFITRAKNRRNGGRNYGGEIQTGQHCRRNSKERLTQTIDVNKDDMPEIVMSQSPRRKDGGAPNGQDKLLKDLYVKMSHNDIRDSKSAFKLLRTSLEASRQMKQSASINAESPARIGGIEGQQALQAAAKKQLATVLNESGYVDFKQTLRRYKDQTLRESLNGHKKH